MSEVTDAGGYAQMPAEQPTGPVTRGPVPSSVETAVKLMFASAALGLLSVLALFATKSSLRTQIVKANPSADPAKVDSMVTAALAIGAVVGLILIALYVLLALQVRKGKNWARIVTWVLGALSVLSALSALVQPEPVANRILSLIGGVLAVAIIVLLAQRPSNEYFRRTG